jgi:hypothetical protein
MKLSERFDATVWPGRGVRDFAAIAAYLLFLSSMVTNHPLDLLGAGEHLDIVVGTRPTISQLSTVDGFDSLTIFCIQPPNR